MAAAITNYHYTPIKPNSNGPIVTAYFCPGQKGRKVGPVPVLKKEGLSSPRQQEKGEELFSEQNLRGQNASR
ncbi:hypothetical protein CEXT_182151 [Caerostris extrusa]|uniref:Uncharacterized protein n=1 Tax=Caerostris extrusa TaxID=172846 RepID=A0AAV4PKS8_CAEEX|nr:hypothetical protein CEXT_182151 [Caerostris extrusa]